MRLYLRVIASSIYAIMGLTACNEVWVKHFPNLEAAKKEGLIKKGWIPAFTPQDATDLVVSGDLDSSIAVGSFISADPSSIRAECPHASHSTAIPIYASRWLQVEDGSTSTTLKNKGYEMLSCGVHGFDMANLTSKHQFYYWTSHIN